MKIMLGNGLRGVSRWIVLAVVLTGFARAGAQAPAVVQMPFAGLVAGGGTVCSGALDTAGDGCPAAQSTLNAPGGTAIDALGNIYIADQSNLSLRVIYKEGAALASAIVAANSNVSGLVPQSGYIYKLAGGYTAILTASGGDFYCNNSGSGAQALDSLGDKCPGYQTFSKPLGVAVDASGNVFFTDNIFTLIGVRVLYVGGSAASALIESEEGTGVTPQPGYVYSLTHGASGHYNGDGGSAINANFVAMEGLAVDSNENIYITDPTAAVVRMIDGNSADTLHTYGDIYTYAGGAGCTESATTTSCPIGYSGDGGAATSASLGAPYNVFLDASSNLYIVTYDSAATTSHLRAVYTAGTLPGISSPAAGDIYTVIGGGSTHTSGTAATSIGLSVAEAGGIDNSGNLYIYDNTNHALWQVNPVTDIGVILAGSATTPTSGAYCNGGTSGPKASDAFGDGCPGIESPFTPAISIALGSSGNFYAAQTSNSLLREFSWRTQFPATAVGSSVQQPQAFYVLSTSTFASESFLLQGITTSEFSDAGSSVDTCTLGTSETAGTMCVFYLKFAPAQAGSRKGSLSFSNGSTTLASTYLGGTGLAANLSVDPAVQSTLGSGLQPTGVSTDASGNLYVADSTAGHVVKIPAGGGTATTLMTGLSHPAQTAVDGFGNVYVADTSNNRVAELTGGTVISLGTGLSGPKGVAINALGDVFIADTGNNRVVKIFAGGGQVTLGFTGLSSPTQLAVDSAGDVFVVGSGTTPVVELPAASSAQTTIAIGSPIVPSAIAIDAAGDLYITDTTSLSVLELPAGSTSVSTLVSSALKTPVGMAVDANGSVYVADSAQAGILEFNRNAVAIAFPFTEVGQSSSSQSSILLSNTGNANLVLSGTALTTATGDTSVFSIAAATSNGCTLSESLNPGSQCGLTGTYTPATSATNTETATFNSNADNSSANAVLSATGAVPVNTATWPVGVYETEGGTLRGTAAVIGNADGSSRTPGDLAGEASGRQAVTLNAPGDSVTITPSSAYAGANAVVVRYSIPDLIGGGGDATVLNLTVKDSSGTAVDQEKLHLTSRYAWLYGALGIGVHLWNSPADATANAQGGASDPTHLYDEIQIMLSTPLPSGGTITLRKPLGGDSKVVTVDLIEVEVVPAPLTMPAGFLSITDPTCNSALGVALPFDVNMTGDVFDGVDDSSYASVFNAAIGNNPGTPVQSGTNEKDYYTNATGDYLQDTAATPLSYIPGPSGDMFHLADLNFAALRACVITVANNPATYSGVWIPPGRFFMRGALTLRNSTRIEGAGMWYSKLVAVDTGTPTSLSGGIEGTPGNLTLVAEPIASGGSSNVVLSNFSMFGNVTERVSLDNLPSGYEVSAISGEFINSQFDHLWIEHYSLGIYISGTSDNLLVSNDRVRNLFAGGIILQGSTSNSTVENSSVRSNGDDGIALWSSLGQPTNPQGINNTILNSTAQLQWIGDGLAIYGGTNNSIQSSQVADVLAIAGVQVSSQYVVAPPSPPALGDTMSATVNDVTITRCGGNWVNVPNAGALYIASDEETVGSTSINNVKIYNSLHAGVDMRNMNTNHSLSPQLNGVSLNNIDILGGTSCGTVGTSTTGSATLSNVCSCATTTSTPASCSPTNSSSSTFTINTTNACSISSCTF